MIDQWNEYDMEMQFIVEMRPCIKDEATQEFLLFSPRKLFDS